MLARQDVIHDGGKDERGTCTDDDWNVFVSVQTRIRNYPESYQQILVVSTLIATANISVFPSVSLVVNFQTLPTGPV